MQIIIEPTGDMRMIDSDAIDVDALGIGVRRRVSHVLPVNPVLRSVFRYLRDRFGETGRVAEFTRRWPCLWQADMSPVGGPVLGPYRDRAEAIENEVVWLERNWL